MALNNLKLTAFYRKYESYILLFIFLILGLILRLHHIGLRPYWLDEANSVNLVFLKFSDLYGQIITTGNSLAYIYFIKIWSYFFGSSELAIRSLSILAGLLAIILIYKLGRLLFNKTAALWAAFLLAVNYFSIFYSIQARPYSLEILFSILSYFYFAKILKSAGWANLIFYILFTAVGVYFHPWFFLVFVSQIFYLLIARNRNFKIYLSQAAIAIICLPWVAILIKLAKLGFSEFITGADLTAIAWTLYYFTYGNKNLILLFSIIALFAMVFQKKNSHGNIEISIREEALNNFNKNNLLVHNYLLFPLLSAFFIAQFIPFYETGRYEAVVLPAFILILASLWSNFKNKIIIVLIGLSLIYGSFSAVQEEKNTILSFKLNDRTVTQEILNRITDGDWLVFTGLSRPPFDYYLDNLNQNHKIFNKFSFPAEMADHPAFLNEKRLMNNYDKINQEADELLEKFVSSEANKMFVVYSGGETSQLLVDKLNKKLKNALTVEVADKDSFGGNYHSLNFHFLSILIYEK
ncbi:MAG: glycosyltransferase family 39 protein [Candidatus Falkowbacteria bacterium]